MKKKKRNIAEIILPNKAFNIFMASILILGIISGTIFLIMLSSQDKNNVIKKITLFISNINKDSVNNGLAIKNSLIINYTYILLIWLLGLSIIGLIVNIFIVYIKGFITGFSISAIILTYKYKSIPFILLYIFPHQVINILLIITISIYSIIFSKNLMQTIINKKNTNKNIFKKYIVILLISIIFSFLSSMSEVYIFPKILKLIIKLYI